jgi:hypothetical protein
VPNGGPTAESSSLLNLSNFVESSLDTLLEPISIAPSSFNTDVPGYKDHTPVKEAERIDLPKSHVLRGSTPKGTNEVASMPELFLDPSSLTREFACSTQALNSGASNADGKDSVPISSSGTSRMPLKKWYLHRAPSGKLTAIPPSPLCQDVTKNLLEEAEESTGHKSPSHGYIYAGYRIFNEDPRKHLGLEFDPKMDEPTLEKKKVDVGAAAETPLADPSCFPFPSDDDTGYSSYSESSTGTLSTRRDFPTASKSLGPFVLCPKSAAVEEDTLLDATNAQSSEVFQGPKGSPKQIRHMSFSFPDCHPKGYERFFNPPLKQEVEFEERQAPQPKPSDAPDDARMQFKSRRGPLWDWANKQLERLFLHGANLSESEFVELVYCDNDQVQAWLDEHSPRIIRRSMERWFKANNVLKNAGIKPNELNENVLDIFEWMTKQEQANFVKAYQRLYAIVKASQEGLHLTRSEMVHFSRLSLTDKINFIDEYKDRRELRERIVRRDTARFTAKLRRYQRDQDDLPFADCSDLDFLQSRPGLTPKGSQIPQKINPTVADNFHVKYLRFGTGQQKSGDASSISTYVPTLGSIPQVKPSAESKVISAHEQHIWRRPTTFTGDGRARYRKLGAAKAVHETAKVDQALEETQDSTTPWDIYSGPKECFINICELLSSSDSEEATEITKDAARLKWTAQGFKQKIETNNVEDKTVNDALPDSGRFTTSQLSEVLRCENPNKPLLTGEAEDRATIEALPLVPLPERSPRKEWHGEHPGAKLPYPTPPPTELSAEGVILPVTSARSLVNDKPLTNLCISDATPIVDNCQPLTTTKSEPCTPCHQISSSSKGPSISYITPPRPPYRTVRGLPSAYVSENDLKCALPENSPEKPKSLKKRVSNLWGSLRSKKSRDALKDLKYY